MRGEGREGERKSDDERVSEGGKESIGRNAELS